MDWALVPAGGTQPCVRRAEESRATVEDSKDSCIGIESQAMEITLKGFPPKVVNIPWRNNNLSNLHTVAPLSEQGETIVGVYLLVLGESIIIQGIAIKRAVFMFCSRTNVGMAKFSIQ